MPREQDEEKAQHQVGTVHTITDLEGYPGESIAEKVDAAIEEHPVLMIDRSWCLFSNE